MSSAHKASLAALNAPLDLIDVKERRKDRALRLAASIVGNLLILALLLALFLGWRGYI